MKLLYLTLDLGGTHLRLAVLDEQAQILELLKISSDQVRTGESLIEVLSQNCQALLKKYPTITGIALGIPGLIDAKAGTVLQSPHFPQWRQVKLVAALAEKIQLPMVMENDANLAALGESWRGAGKDLSSFVLLTLGTGIGGGMIVDKKLFRGPTGFAGEIGHIVIDRHQLPGELGSEGTLESLASQSGLRTQLWAIQNSIIKLDPSLAALNAKDPSLPETLFHLAKNGNSAAQQVWQDFGSALGCGIASLAHTLGIFDFIIGGGIAAAWESFADACLMEAQRRSYSVLANRITIRPAALGNDAALVGGVARLRNANDF